MAAAIGFWIMIHDQACSGSEHLLGIWEPGGNDRSTDPDCLGDDSGRDLVVVVVRHDNHVRCAHQVVELGVVDIPVDELDDVRQLQFSHEILEHRAIGRARPCGHHRVRPADDAIANGRIHVTELRQCRQGPLDPFPRAEKTPCDQLVPGWRVHWPG